MRHGNEFGANSSMSVVNVYCCHLSSEHDDELEQDVDRGYHWNLTSGSHHEILDSLQRSHLRQRREQVYAYAKLQMRSRYLYVLQGVLLLP